MYDTQCTCTCNYEGFQSRVLYRHLLDLYQYTYNSIAYNKHTTAGLFHDYIVQTSQIVIVHEYIKMNTVCNNKLSYHYLAITACTLNVNRMYHANNMSISYTMIMQYDTHYYTMLNHSVHSLIK